jgi:putative colanic acid biosynthesis acetyltransferase WcaF
VAAVAFVGPGVEIGTGAIVSAGSVVFENVPPNTVVRGNPARAL